MSDDTKKPKLAVPPVDPRSPEEKQLSAIGDALECAEAVREIVSEVPLTLANINQLHKYGAWMDSIRMNLRRDYNELAQKIPQGTPPAPIAQ